MLAMGSLSDGARHLLKVDYHGYFLVQQGYSRQVLLTRLIIYPASTPPCIPVSQHVHAVTADWAHFSTTQWKCEHKARKMENRSTLPYTVPEEILLLAEGVGFAGCELGGAGAGTTKATSLRASDQYNTWDRPLNPLPP